MSGGGEIATQALSAATVGMEQQPEIAAFHQAEAVSNQADRAIAEIMGLPGAARQAAHGEEDFRDLAVACLIETTVERTQSEEEPVRLARDSVAGSGPGSRPVRARQRRSADLARRSNN